MKTRAISLFTLVAYFILFSFGCNKGILEPENEGFKVDSFISKIKSFDISADYKEDIIPVDTLSNEKPYVSVQSWVIKGKDILMSITVPDNAEEIYFGALNSQTEYMGLNFSGTEQNAATGYYRLPLANLVKSKNATKGLKNYLVVLSSNENIQLSGFELIVSYKTPDGISNIISVPLDVIAISPFQKVLKVGFTPMTDYTYSITISAPDGTQIFYSYDKDSGSETFDGTQSNGSSLSYDKDMNFKWIDLDPTFGNYTMTATFQIDLSNETQYIYLLLAILTEGKIDQIDLDANVEQTGENTAVGTVNLIFGYFKEKRVIVDIIAHRPQNHYIPYNLLFDLGQMEASNIQIVPEFEENSKGAGIRINTNKYSSYYRGTNRNLLQADLHISNNSNSTDINYYLINQSNNIVVYNDFKMADILSEPGHETNIKFSSDNETKSVWIEALGKVNYEFLILQARDAYDNTILSADTIRLRTFESVVFCFRGEEMPIPNSVEMNGVPDNQQGVFNVSDQLYRMGYDARKFSDNDRSIAFNEIEAMLMNNSVDNYLFIGYSHGAGTISLLLDENINNYLIKNNTSIHIPYAAYIDAIKHDYTVNIFAVTEKPDLIKYLHNFYQTNIPNWCIFYGCGIAGGQDNSVNNEDCTAIAKTHCDIHQIPSIKSKIINDILQYPR